ncbi:Uncharacterised protein [Mycobacteroides abscessus subsp. abscessus]|uniref:Transmembrane protein n=4 Tax=Mycobacteroides abscessus TaxID=36809 RepID=B1MMC9_MYCA9|nr:hypothetical protein AOY11_24445 [Mycobacteroides abscessus]EIU37635.1 hypothetical protein MA6G0125S_5086 [Mycobacteroides abscessus 6G-0125-S]EIU40283.1 hypothetical protein MA6G0125R_4045 [Mycobacteroides abscessus 6G-0125-R]EIU52543.1 hypothetical protein MA6G1108_5015 [Mycobacteroides abscessus 6G-1108]EIU54548.1 hypothetical protein MA6G0728S_4777 [Mycobacteroides abscessus 6G-0728-S]EIU90108.1 hypothetical protein MA6G0212_5072 [Mycobacteroides abscessus 6G-0212]EIU96200.1 hypotheti
MNLHIDWMALGRVVALSAVVGVAIVAAFSVGVLGISRADTAVSDGIIDQPRRMSGYLQAAVMHGLCIAAVAYGLYLLIPQFH